MNLSVVHALGTCPMGENPDLCATDSFGAVHGFRNLRVHDASLFPDSPGVNPQGPTMALALRNSERMLERATGADGPIVFHVAGVIHPEHGTREFDAVNVGGTRHVLDAARAAGVRRVVAVSSNSPFGFNRDPADVFDESSPYHPYQGYGRSKAEA